ncbi:hypothetical protein CEXT_396711 [Caerostris extrusa]|uniref:Ycf15 n=1 Tax=Caerostris extrusa TaxID=172846 RepID=A0AAV4TAF2_CAEEX|nr:hypothetical protein CEXT_396711 [Caerostris extrusa]
MEQRIISGDTLEPLLIPMQGKARTDGRFPCSPFDWTRARKIRIICHGRQFYCETKFRGFLWKAPSVMLRRKRSAFRGSRESFPLIYA